MESSAKSVDEVVEEIMRTHRSLPPRPGIEDVEGAKILIRNADSELQSRLESIAKLKKRKDVPDELFGVLVEMQKHLVHFQTMEQKREAVKLLDLENYHLVFDEMIQRASKCVVPSGSDNNIPSVASTSSSISSLTNSAFSGANFSGNPSSTVSVTPVSTFSLYYDKEPVKTSELFTRDDSYLQKSQSTIHGDGIGRVLRMSDTSRPMIVDSTLKPTITSGQDGEKLSLIRLASLIEVSSKKGAKDLNLGSKLMDQIEWLPDSIGKLSSLITLDLSENRLVALPSSIGGLSSLTKLDLHSNKILELPESIGDLLNLVHLDLRANQLTSLPATFGRLFHLQELDLSSNNISVLPESVCSLSSLQILNIETNNIEELPHAIGQCSSLKELIADYNKLKALPEAVGKIESLEKLSVRYNNIGRLPTTMSSLTSLKELDVSFNELESVPESLCFATSLIKINVSNNFADLRFLPRSIGNLENLEELDMSNNQIRILPDSFRMLSKLRLLKAEGNPLELPPQSILDQGAHAVIQYMNELHEKKEVKAQPVKQKKSWAQICFFSRTNKRKRNGMDYVKT
ncbi:plant intracellular Ras-group-related LRR protein 4-like [Cynara cardunculus var. scolymus]|uniref:plant intracellular Ras-group-related LRR protein 4-like n=1 Tax=Cynara cardunculus var. scolymus TaxID=59895 RepID=UPI000D626107|nr:plant intracellular Ras-group-related LRR protein 4-like [Cynara cardunculus var. scolymus]XP_024978448.1 plant intracellular Ras-group-related LRR protein 4-like [Cynara cardunculus var. scolymus]XP_024978449.1 plant intracellular Ras-group-related LRR protein 4-like [Cynara cardunculus var. scolymus]XP_024978450.1 plant intracellular Ras-group-related LRR protein 4-like [Cynara cardunculus var. scolymus]XP_024978451.1 plant intracellular Ras-group-related LRR protein 4-like [Cynara cardunc